MTQKPEKSFYDAYSPAEIAARVENAGIVKTRMPALQTITLGILAGAFIAFGGMFYTLVISGNDLGFGLTKLIGGMVFSLGLILVVVAGAELFTGNNLIVLAWADKRVSLYELLRNWLLVYLGNFIGSALMVYLVILAGSLEAGNGVVAETAQKIALGKVQLTFEEAFFRGVLCNALVCLAVWLCFAAHSVADKILAIIFPISAFVALGFEHSIANMYLIPVGYFAGASEITIADFVLNIIPVTLGNIIGGSVFVALVYWIIYIRK